MKGAAVLLLGCLFLAPACGPIPPPTAAYANGGDLLHDVTALREKVHSFRMSGRVDHFGENRLVRGKIYLFAKRPGRLRVELISPFSTPLSVLTVNQDKFGLHYLNEGRYLQGEATPCNIARLVRIPLPPDDVIQILVGHTPIIPGNPKITWDRKGFYRVVIKNESMTQTLHIGPTRGELPLLESHLSDKNGTVFRITYDRWFEAGGISTPHEIRVEMPRDKADLRIRFNPGGIELNPDLPEDAFIVMPPPGRAVEQVTCH